ncbi:hypothetical protein J5N97_003352 [Dioscorea zingiberensis]|uniref:Retrovirus-related Pol polyprotein from transposon TNT 1-94-like beta-barrel domain-containing protein n=1 Tax=Dioscorea zingiberensis TaxID=325984 RepID=A0A9D5D419_9LILI|nr:hypothetical protein J5N97_003352 [Dioscorea zingiberensis]
MQLSTLQKKDLSISDYFRKVKNLTDTLSAIGNPLQEEEIVSYLLAGLGSEYDPLVTSVTTRIDPITMGDLYAHLLSFELRLEHNSTSLQIAATNNVSRNPTNQGRGSSRNNRGRGRGRGGRFPNGCGNPAQGSNGPRSICQVCGKPGREALHCYHRFDHTYSEENRVAATITGNSYSVDPNWYVDIGATDHITNDLERLTTKESYGGSDQVQVANGAGLSITYTGNSSLAGYTKPLFLKNILHVPQINRHLLSVHKLALDNNAFVEFHPDCFLVKDQATKTTILKGKYKGGLYALAHCRPNQALFSAKITQEQWH